MLDEAKTGNIATPMFSDFDGAYAFCSEIIRQYKPTR